MSQAPPALFWKIAHITPDTQTPAIYPPKGSAPKTKPIIIGVIIVINPGKIISFKAAFVEISTHFAYSGVPVPSIIPGISLN